MSSAPGSLRRDIGAAILRAGLKQPAQPERAAGGFARQKSDVFKPHASPKRDSLGVAAVRPDMNGSARRALCQPVASGGAPCLEQPPPQPAPLEPRRQVQVQMRRIRLAHLRRRGLRVVDRPSAPFVRRPTLSRLPIRRRRPRAQRRPPFGLLARGEPVGVQDADREAADALLGLGDKTQFGREPQIGQRIDFSDEPRGLIQRRRVAAAMPCRDRDSDDGGFVRRGGAANLRAAAL